MKFSIDVHGVQRINHGDFGDNCLVALLEVFTNHVKYQRVLDGLGTDFTGIIGDLRTFHLAGKLQQLLDGI